MSKIFFYGYGLRDTKNWSCTNCNNYHTCGMDLMVEKNTRDHLDKCLNAAAPAGYHTRNIWRGIFGQISKIREELNELEDAVEQDVKVMIGCELSDLYGALREYAKNQGYTMLDLEKMADITKKVFESGHRKSRD